MSSYRGLEVIVEYYDHRIDTFNREVSHWFKPTFGTSSFSTAIINFVKKEYPEIDAENIEVNPILDELPFDNGDYNTLGLLQISGLTICDWKKSLQTFRSTPFQHGMELKTRLFYTFHVRFPVRLCNT